MTPLKIQYISQVRRGRYEHGKNQPLSHNKLFILSSFSVQLKNLISQLLLMRTNTFLNEAEGHPFCAGLK